MVRSNNNNYLLIPFLMMLAIGAVSIIWINFHSTLWYSSDIYTYTLEGKHMFETGSLFPEGWIFGNQYQIFASPSIAALFYGLCHDSVMAMSLASSLSLILVLVSFLWCFWNFVPKEGIAAGALCLGGGFIFGTNAATYVSGLQVLYTMASFYACYLIVILLTIGCWLRLKEGGKVPWAMCAFILPLNFLLGMQSPREMLILVIPLLIIEGVELLFRLYKKEPVRRILENARATVLSLLVFVVELAGHFYMKTLDVPSTPIIGDLQLDLSLRGLAANIWLATKNVLRVSGIAIAKDGLKYIPLSVCSLAVVGMVILSIISIIRRKDYGALAKAIIFSFISVLCVYGVGIFLMRTRDIYYFVYWLLAALSAVYCLREAAGWKKMALMSAVLFICIINYCYTFIPNYVDYRDNQKKLDSFTERLTDDGIRVIYVNATPIFAANSHDRILSQTFWLDPGLLSGYPLTAFPSDKYLPAYDDRHYEGSLICFSSDVLGHLEESPEAFREALFGNVEFYGEMTLGPRRFKLYKPLKRIINPDFVTSPYGK